MAKDTITLLSILKNLSRSELGVVFEDYTNMNEFVKETQHLLFNQTPYQYPIFDESYREVLNTKIVEHFIFEEISTIPYQRWQFMFNRKLNEIMPYYNKLYLSDTLEFNPLYDTDYTETLDRDVGVDTETSTQRESESTNQREQQNTSNKQVESASNQNENLSSQSDSENYEASTPFNRNDSGNNADKLSGEQVKASANNTYSGLQNEDETREDELTSLQNQEEMSQSQSQLQTATTEDYIKKVSGKRGTLSPTKMLTDYRQSLLNIDMMVIHELETLFRFILN